MRVWLVQLGEPIPSDSGWRLYRCGLLAEALVAAGHHVTWWTSAFSHYSKRFRVDRDQTVDFGPRYRVELLHTRGYRRNVSLARLRFHRQVAARFRERVQLATPPTIVMCGFPTPSLAAASVEYARSAGVPVVVDVRDVWPDALISGRLSTPLGLAARTAGAFHRKIFARADGVVAISQSYLEWALSHAGRGVRALDAVVPMGYPDTQIADGELHDASSRWLARGIVPNKFVGCFFGSINRHFDMITIIRTARLLAQAGDDRFQFVLCGDGAHRERVQRLASDLSTVILPGWVSASEVTALMGMSKVGFAPYAATAKMSLPNKPFEYFSAGLPVLSSLQGELKTLLTENRAGLTYASGNPYELRDKLVNMADDEPGSLEMGRNARRLFDEQFNSQRVTRRLVSYLERVSQARYPSDRRPCFFEGADEQGCAS